MPTLTRLIARARDAIRKGNALSEAVGFALLGMGLFMLLSLGSHTLLQTAGTAAGASPLPNWGGPLGNGMAAWMLKSIGLIGYVWTATLLVSGLLMAFGFVRWPKARRFVALFALTFVLAGLAHLHVPDSAVSYLPNGAGGIVGLTLAPTLVTAAGYGGATLLLIVTGIAMLALTGNITVSKTADLLEYGVYLLRRLLARPGASGTRQTSTIAAPDETPNASKSSERPKTPAKSGKPKRSKTPQALPDSGVGLVADFSSAAPKSSQPDRGIFGVAESTSGGGEDLKALSQQLGQRLRDFKIDGTVSDVTEGPVVTTMEFEPAPGTKSSKIVALGEDLARLLATESLRVVPSIPGRATVGFEIPNHQRRIIRFGNVLKDFKKESKGMTLPIVLGVDTFGATVIEDLTEMPHLLVAGTTGSGKSAFINTLIASLVYANPARELRLVMVDPKMIELAVYEKLPHLACPVVKDLEGEGERVLEGLVTEMEDRFRRMGAVGARNIVAFNRTIRSSRKPQYIKFEGRWEPMPYVVLLVDEFADMILVLGKRAETAVTRLAQKARAAGIHLVIATQRPSADVVTGLIKANFPTRIAFRVQSGVDSRTILDQSGAETLLGKGDMLYQSATGIQRLHAPFLEDNEVTEFVNACAA
ncbi:MAG: DNA translocase FtsK 4TM domain-containing protein [Planctomycetes bacterium]|nr:DNA translocase FtsK 4TM domain-containing protein [Planctomycetota bacterium]